MKERDTLKIDYPFNSFDERGAEDTYSVLETLSLVQNSDSDQTTIPAAFSISAFCDNMRGDTELLFAPRAPNIDPDTGLQISFSVSKFLQNICSSVAPLPALAAVPVAQNIAIPLAQPATTAVPAPYIKVKRRRIIDNLQNMTHFWMWGNRLMALAVIFACAVVFTPPIIDYVRTSPEIARAAKSFSDQAKGDAISLKHKVQSTKDKMSTEVGCLNNAMECMVDN